MRRALALALVLASCHGEPARADKGPQKEAPPVSSLPMGAVRFETPRGPWVVKVEIARTDEQRERGLMYRRSLEPDHGMIFLFTETAEHGFWMHNTLLALDMIFVGEDRWVVGVIEDAQPMTDTLRTVKKPSRYVIEVASGEAAAHAVGPGTPAVFIDIPED